MLKAKRLALCAAFFLFGGAAANASPYVVTFEQVGSNIVAAGGGSIDLNGLTFAVTEPNHVFIDPGGTDLITGTVGNVDDYVLPSTFTGPSTFGSGPGTFASSGTGDNVGFDCCNGFAGLVFVPVGYVSNTALSDSAIYDNATFTSLGIIPGTYTWTWGSNADQSFTLEIGQTPIPAALPLFAAGLGLLGLLCWSLKRRAQAVAA